MTKEVPVLSYSNMITINLLFLILYIILYYFKIHNIVAISLFLSALMSIITSYCVYSNSNKKIESIPKLSLWGMIFIYFMITFCLGFVYFKNFPDVNGFIIILTPIIVITFVVYSHSNKIE
jgi:hypothetical protein